MEVIRHGDHRYTMQTYTSNGRLHAYVLQLNQPVGDARMPRFVQRYDLPDSYKTKNDALEQAKRAANQLETGELETDGISTDGTSTDGTSTDGTGHRYRLPLETTRGKICMRAAIRCSC